MPRRKNIRGGPQSVCWGENREEISSKTMGLPHRGIYSPRVGTVLEFMDSYPQNSGGGYIEGNHPDTRGMNW